jgi:hypothetical protein
LENQMATLSDAYRDHDGEEIRRRLHLGLPLSVEQQRLLDDRRKKADQFSPFRELATPDQWRRLDDTVYGLRAMLDDARSMRRRDVAILSDAFSFCRELLLRRPAEFGGPRECR